MLPQGHYLKWDETANRFEFDGVVWVSGSNTSSFKSSDTPITSTNFSYGNGTNTGLSVTLDQGTWVIIYDCSLMLQDSTTGYYKVNLWLQDGSSIVDSISVYCPAMAAPTQLYNQVNRTFITTVSVDSQKTFTVFGSKDSSLDTFYVLASAADQGKRSRIIAYRV